MAFFVPSATCGIGSGFLAKCLDGSIGRALLNGAAPSFYSAFMYGAACNSASRVIEFSARELCKKQQLSDNIAVMITVVVIASQVFSSYAIASELRKSLDIAIPRNFIHVENALFMASVLAVDFELTANRIKENTFPGAIDPRLTTHMWLNIQYLYNEVREEF